MLLDLFANDADFVTLVTRYHAKINTRLWTSFFSLKIPLIINKLLKSTILLLCQVFRLHHSLIINVLAQFNCHLPYFFFILFYFKFVGISGIARIATLLKLS